MKIRVLHFVENLERAGTGLQLLRFLRHSNRDLLDHSVLTLIPGSLTQEVAQLRIPVTAVGARFKYNPAIVKNLRSAIVNYRPHFLHSYLAQPNLLCAAAGHVLGAPRVILEERGVELGSAHCG